MANYQARASAALLAIAASSSATAWVQICNGRGDDVTTAFAAARMDAAGTSTSGHRGAAVEGWWKLSPGECATVSEDNASQNWLYFHAKSGSGSLEGSARLCVRSKAFNNRQSFLMQGQTCASGWREAGFVRHESSSKNYKFTVR